MLAYKPDWEGVKERYLAWWEGEVVDRCCIAVYAPRDGMPPEEPPALPAKVENRWLDLDYLRAANDYRLRHTFFGGEALPIWHPGYPGWSGHNVFLGCPISLAEDTGWTDPLIGDGALTDYDYHDFILDPRNHWWRFTQEMLRVAAREARGQALPGILALGGCGDTLAALRGNLRLLYDLVDCPDYVRAFDQYLMRQWMEIYETLYRIVHEGCEGSTCWFDLWSPGKFYSSHNDFAYMISPAMFEEIFLPSLEMQTQYLDHTVHHVDGIGNFNHVDLLCELPRLQALQILPGAGKPSPLHYMDVLQKVQAKGKNLHISIPPEEVEIALRELKVEGLFIQTWCAGEAEARALLDNTVKWSRRNVVL